MKIESVKKIFEVQNLMNNVEIKGMSNIAVMYKAMLLMQEITIELQEDMATDNGITIDNTKEKK